MTAFGWQAHFTQEFVRDGWRMHLWRRTSAGIEAASGELTITTYAEHAAVEATGIYLPHDAYQAIVSAIDPPAHKAELARLEEALAVERGRVDLALRTMLEVTP